MVSGENKAHGQPDADEGNHPHALAQGGHGRLLVPVGDGPHRLEPPDEKVLAGGSRNPDGREAQHDGPPAGDGFEPPSRPELFEFPRDRGGDFLLERDEIRIPEAADDFAGLQHHFMDGLDVADHRRDFLEKRHDVQDALEYPHGLAAPVPQVVERDRQRDGMGAGALVEIQPLDIRGAVFGRGGFLPPEFVGLPVVARFVRGGDEPAQAVRHHDLREAGVALLEFLQLPREVVLEAGRQFRRIHRERWPPGVQRIDGRLGSRQRRLAGLHRLDLRADVLEVDPLVQQVDLVPQGVADREGELRRGGLADGPLRSPVVLFAEPVERDQGDPEREQRGDGQDADEFGADAELHGGWLLFYVQARIARVP